MEEALESVSEHRQSEGAARAHASTCLNEATDHMMTEDWADCEASCESGLKDPDGVNDPTLTGKLEALLGLSVGNQKLILVSTRRNPDPVACL